LTATTYRREIDGLRAIAILAVLVYHAQVSVFGTQILVSGYLGVDVFFVISGYLIARILMTELDETGRISFLGFYARRARRILPALIGVSLASLCAAWFYLLPLDFVDFSASVIASFLFVSNIFFYVETTEYSADSALMEPFLHTWSLSVEEQFYLVFPVMLIALYRWRPDRLMTGFLCLSAASFAFAAIFTPIDPDLSFYLPFSRIWEMLAGAIVAMLELRRHRWLDLAAARTWMPLVGCLMILGPLFIPLPQSLHPGPATLLPVLGTALVLAYGSISGPVGSALASRPMVVIGLLSYSLYLWHFPIFAFGRMSGADPVLSNKLVWVAAAVILSAISYVVIEQPFRSRTAFGPRACGVSLAASIGAIFTVNTVILVDGGFPERVPAAAPLRRADRIPIAHRRRTKMSQPSR
jgi:peptidoglycan/LPS O-acetylase OafA/YrhL